MTNPIKTTSIMSELLQIRHRVQRERPLVHCTTNPISMRDCADTLLAISARPIMAEYPPEAAQVIAQTRAFAVNLGSISASRMEAMMTSGRTVLRKNIPCVIDAVGVACNSPRLFFARDFIRECRPCMIKGNNSELRVLAGLPNYAQGVDAGEQDRVTEDSLDEHIAMLVQLALDTGAVITCTGTIDLVTDGRRAYILRNGCETMSLLTGTGCMLGTLAAGFLAGGEPLNAALPAVSYFGMCGGLTQKEYQGPSSFSLRLVDLLHMIAGRQLEETVNCTVYNGRMEHA